MTVLGTEATPQGLPLMLRMGVGATPIDCEFVDDCGDVYLWDEFDEVVLTLSSA